METKELETAGEKPEEKPEEKKDSAKVRIRRVAGVDPITAFSYTPFRTPEMDSQPHSNAMRDFHPDPTKDEFEVSADIAAAAVETGGFEVDESSRVRLRTTDGGRQETGLRPPVTGQSSEGGE